MANTSLIGLTLPVTGTQSGQWGDTVNNAISQIVDVAGAGTQTVTTDADVDLTLTTGTYASTGLTSTSSQYAVLLCTGARTAARNINTPKQSKPTLSSMIRLVALQLRFAVALHLLQRVYLWRLAHGQSLLGMVLTLLMWAVVLRQAPIRRFSSTTLVLLALLLT